MPATTRSANKQTKLEDVGAGSVSTKSTKSKSTASGQKRKAVEGPKSSVSKAPKKAKQSNDAGKSSTKDGGDVIIINRAPVLELWGSCVAQFLYPSMSWETCLGVGAAIATITAISKGRSIGKIDKPDPGDAQKKRDDRKANAEREGFDELEVMSFKLNLDKDGHALVGDKAKKEGEDALMRKYGGAEQYEKVKETFTDALKSWNHQKDDLNSRAFHFYEDFRPSVKLGQQGWGRKGQLSLQTIRDVVVNA